MKTRILTAMVGLPLAFVLLLFPSANVFAFIIAAVIVIGVLEMASALKVQKNPAFMIPTLLYAVALPIFTMDFFYQGATYYLAMVAALTFLYMLVMFCVTVLSNGKVVFSTVAQVVIGIIYVVIGLVSLGLIRRFENGIALCFMPFIGAWATDGFAYFVGVFFGKHKLCPVISPKKTIEGSVGGLVLGTLSVVLYGLVLQLATDLTPNYAMFACLGLGIAVLSQMGDLIASLLKREHGVKDFGKLIPGHGGVVDRFDSVISVSPLLTMVCLLPQNISFFF